ncbi:MAG: hypothetical protein HN730_10670 [Bdellovibrionales bacterium]|jgi:hypothetical protein|nr:hypothetical protein [Bdellovibrionales bacterium]MBT7767610.1 hypothetical protein [Bdellovibrionales bacterium]
MSAEKALILHKYFLAASLMKSHFESYLKARDKEIAVNKDPNLMNYMLLWYGTLFVVVEGVLPVSERDNRSHIL